MFMCLQDKKFSCGAYLKRPNENNTYYCGVIGLI